MPTKNQMRTSEYARTRKIHSLAHRHTSCGCTLIFGERFPPTGRTVQLKPANAEKFSAYVSVWIFFYRFSVFVIFFIYLCVSGVCDHSLLRAFIELTVNVDTGEHIYFRSILARIFHRRTNFLLYSHFP